MGANGAQLGPTNSDQLGQTVCRRPEEKGGFSKTNQLCSEVRTVPQIATFDCKGRPCISSSFSFCPDNNGKFQGSFICND